MQMSSLIKGDADSFIGLLTTHKLRKRSVLNNLSHCENQATLADDFDAKASNKKWPSTVL